MRALQARRLKRNSVYYCFVLQHLYGPLVEGPSGAYSSMKRLCVSLMAGKIQLGRHLCGMQPDNQKGMLS